MTNILPPHFSAVHQAIKYLLELQTDKGDVRDVLK